MGTSGVLGGGVSTPCKLPTDEPVPQGFPVLHDFGHHRRSGVQVHRPTGTDLAAEQVDRHRAVSRAGEPGAERERSMRSVLHRPAVDGDL
jgi:hypothetical protein